MARQPQLACRHVRPGLDEHGVAAADRVARADLAEGAPAVGVGGLEQEALALRAQRPAGHAQHRGERRRALSAGQLENAGARHLAAERDDAAQRRDDDTLALAERQVGGWAALAGDHRVEVHRAGAARPALDADGAQRAGLAHAARGRQRVEHVGERRERLHARPPDLAAHEHRDLAQLAEGDEHLRALELRARALLEVGAQLAQGAARGGHGRQVGE